MPELLRSKTVNARKVHACRTCHAAAAKPGETYTRDTYVDDGQVYDWVQCAACRAISNAVYDWIIDAEEGITAADYREWATEHLGDETHGEAAEAFLARCRIAALKTLESSL